MQVSLLACYRPSDTWDTGVPIHLPWRPSRLDARPRLCSSIRRIHLPDRHPKLHATRTLRLTYKNQADMHLVSTIWSQLQEFTRKYKTLAVCTMRISLAW